MVKQSTHNRLSLGSIPSQPTRLPLWTNWQSHLSQKEKFSQFESEQGHHVDMQDCLGYNKVIASMVK
jgi:hypothetical protein